MGFAAMYVSANKQRHTVAALPILPCYLADRDAERPQMRSHAERGNDQTCEQCPYLANRFRI